MKSDHTTSTSVETDLQPVAEMDCRDIAAILSGLVDDELDDDIRHRAERHIVSCAPCTGLIDQTERSNEWLLAEVDTVTALPPGFADTVLAETTRTMRIRPLSGRVITWSGWVAAAASLALALSVLFVENWSSNDASRNPTEAVGQPAEALSGLATYFHERPDHLRSRVSDRYRVLTTETSENTVGGSGAAIETVGHEYPNEPTLRSLGGMIVVGNPLDQLSVNQEERPHQFTPQVRLVRDDEDTLFAAANVLEMMFEVDEFITMSVAERMREIIEYDELLSRLQHTRERLDPRDRPTIFAAESILYRIVYGPVNEADLREMRDNATALDLIGKLARMTGRTNPDNTM